jgi:hypothetical protein
MVRELPVNEYLSEPGVALVNRYAELKHQVREIDQEMDKVKEALVDYSRNNDLEVVGGNSYKVSVTFSEKLKFPGKNDEGRVELENVIKESGKWDEVSTLDTTALKEAVEEEAWNQELVEQIMEYGEMEQSPSVRLSRLKDEEE